MRQDSMKDVFEAKISSAMQKANVATTKLEDPKPIDAFERSFTPSTHAPSPKHIINPAPVVPTMYEDRLHMLEVN